MKKQIAVLTVLMALTTIGFSQTKRIALHSHSGPNSEFDAYSEGNFGEIERPGTKINYYHSTGDTVNLIQTEKKSSDTTKTDTIPAKASPKANNKKTLKPYSMEK